MENQANTGQEKLQFKTTLNCGGCVSKVQSDLDGAAGIDSWNVDIENPDKVLTVQSTGISKDEVIAIVERKGFKAEAI